MRLYIRLCLLTLLVSWNTTGQPVRRTFHHTAEIADQVERLVEDAVAFVQRHKIDNAIATFARDAEWCVAETELFVIDEKDFVWFMARDPNYTWDDLKNIRMMGGTTFAQRIKQAGMQGGWVTFVMNDTFIHSYVKTVRKGKHLFTIGAMSFHQTPERMAQKLLFKADDLVRREGLKCGIVTINNPVGPFLYGSFSVTLYDHEGICLADSFDSGRVGATIAQLTDSSGRPVFEDFQEATAQQAFGVVDHLFQGVLKRTYVFRFVTKNNKNPYFLVSSYYPTVDHRFVIETVRAARSSLEQRGAKETFVDLMRYSERYYRGRIAIVIYDEQGVIQAHTRFPSLVGVNALPMKGQAGYLITQAIFEKVMNEGKGWTFYYVANAAELVYGEKVTLPEGVFIVTAQGYTPVTPQDSAHGMAEWLAKRLALEHPVEVFHALNKAELIRNRGFIPTIGTHSFNDFFVEIYDRQGFCVSAGANFVKMWQRMDSLFQKNVRQLAADQRDGGWFVDQLSDRKRLYYLKRYEQTNSSTHHRTVYYIAVGYFET